MNSNLYKELFSKLPVEPMSNDQSRLMLNLLFADVTNGESIDDDLTQEFLYQVGLKRASYHGLSITPYALLFLVFQCQNPGTLVMYIVYLALLKKEKIDTRILCEIFPKGFPTENALLGLWDKQKIRIGNWVDSVWLHPMIDTGFDAYSKTDEPNVDGLTPLQARAYEFGWNMAEKANE